MAKYCSSILLSTVWTPLACFQTGKSWCYKHTAIKSLLLIFSNTSLPSTIINFPSMNQIKLILKPLQIRDWCVCESKGDTTTTDSDWLTMHILYSREPSQLPNTSPRKTNGPMNIMFARPIITPWLSGTSPVTTKNLISSFSTYKTILIAVCVT